MDYQKGLHYSIEIERAILGVIFLIPNAMARTYGKLKPEYFYHEIHRNIYRVLLLMFQNNYPIDALTATDYFFRREKIFKLADGAPVGYWISRTMNGVTGDAHLEIWCEIITEMYLQRELIALTHGGVKLIGNSRQQIADLILRLNQLNEKRTSDDWKDAESLTIDLYQHQDEMLRSGGMGIQSGFYGIDKINGGFYPGQSILLAARPSVGKSAIAGQFAINMARKKIRVGIINLEMSNNEIAARMAAIITQIDFNTIYRNLFEDEKSRNVFYEKLNRDFATLPIYVSDKTGVDMYEIRAKAAKLKANNNIDILFIDYLQLVESTDKKGRNREQEISEISRGAKAMAKEMGIPVISLAQLNRQIATRKGSDRYPHLTDLRESGSLEQDADVVMFLHRDFMAGYLTDENGDSTEHQADIIIRKWRNGSLGRLRLKFDPPKMRFYENYQQIQTLLPYLPPSFDEGETEKDPF